MKNNAMAGGKSPSRLIDARIKELDDWRGSKLAHVRALIKQADPDIVEEWKWRGVPVGLTTESSAPARRLTGGSFRTVQLEPRRQHQARHRYP